MSFPLHKAVLCIPVKSKADILRMLRQKSGTLGSWLAAPSAEVIAGTLQRSVILSGGAPTRATSSRDGAFASLAPRGSPEKMS